MVPAGATLSVHTCSSHNYGTGCDNRPSGLGYSGFGGFRRTLGVRG